MDNLTENLNKLLDYLKNKKELNKQEQLMIIDTLHLYLPQIVKGEIFKNFKNELINTYTDIIYGKEVLIEMYIFSTEINNNYILNFVYSKNADCKELVLTGVSGFKLIQKEVNQ